MLCVGQAVQDFVFGVETMPDRAEKYRAGVFDTMGGGPAATAAATVASLGGEPLLAARVGDDVIAGMITSELEAYHVDCRHVRRFSGCRSSISAVIVDGAGERMIVNYLDPALPQVPDWLPDPADLGVAAVLADPRWVEGSTRALRQAQAAGLPGILDADQAVTLDSPLLYAASHVAFSAEALASCTGEDEPANGLAMVSEVTDAWTCVTVGSSGVVISAEGVQTRIPAFKVQVADTLGAGDVWHGAFALALAEGGTDLAAARFANAAAAVKVRRAGGRRGVPTRAEVEALLTRAAQPREVR